MIAKRLTARDLLWLCVTVHRWVHAREACRRGACDAHESARKSLHAQVKHASLQGRKAWDASLANPDGSPAVPRPNV